MKTIDWEILTNHLTGISSEIEERKLTEWISESDEHRKYYEHIRKIWLVEAKTFPKPDTEKALGLVLDRIRRSNRAAQTRVVHLPLPSRIPAAINFLARPYVLRAAAAILVAVGTIYLFSILISERESDRTSVTFTSVQTLNLSDGTTITFDIGSSFAYPKSFAGVDEREVFLDGEAYFEVAGNDGRPFIIHATGGRVEVLGTKLNIRAWGQDRRILVAVGEGSVSFQAEDNRDSKNIVYLTENKMSKLLQGTAPTPPEEIDFSKHLAWMKREIYFQNTPVPEVLNQLERWYKVKIEVADSSVLKNNITVFIENKELVENLKLISVVMNVQYVQRGDTVRFVPH